MTCGLDLPRPCKCGHVLGDHSAFHPHTCVAFDYRQSVLFGHARCSCTEFTPIRAAHEPAR